MGDRQARNGASVGASLGAMLGSPGGPVGAGVGAGFGGAVGYIAGSLKPSCGCGRRLLPDGGSSRAPDSGGESATSGTEIPVSEE